MLRSFAAITLALSLSLPHSALAANESERIVEAIALCEKHFGRNDDLVGAFTAAGWIEEVSASTPIQVFTSENRRVIAAFTRRSRQWPACMATGKGRPLAEMIKLAESFVARSGRYQKHPKEKLTWVRENGGKPVWFGVTERQVDFELFHGYAVVLAEKR